MEEKRYLGILRQNVGLIRFITPLNLMYRERLKVENY